MELWVLIFSEPQAFFEFCRTSSHFVTINLYKVNRRQHIQTNWEEKRKRFAFSELRQMIVRMDFAGACGHDMAAVYGVPDMQAGWQLTFSGWFCQLEICKTSGTRLFWVLVQHCKALRLGPLAEAVEARQTHQHFTNAASNMYHVSPACLYTSRCSEFWGFSPALQRSRLSCFWANGTGRLKYAEVCWIWIFDPFHSFFVTSSMKSLQNSGSHSGHGRGWDARTER